MKFLETALEVLAQIGWWLFQKMKRPDQSLKKFLKREEQHVKDVQEIDSGVDASRAGSLLSTYPNDKARKAGSPKIKKS